MGGVRAPLAALAITLLGVAVPLPACTSASEGTGEPSQGHHGCINLCSTLLNNNATQTLDTVAACEKGCITLSHCHEKEAGSAAGLVDVSKVCLAMCENSCAELYGTKPNLKPACVGGCNAQHQQRDNLVTIADAQYLSQRLEILDDAAAGVGIVEDKTHNVSLNLEGNIQTDIKSQAFLGPNLRKNDITTKGAKRMEDKSIKFDLQGEIGNDTISEATLAKHGKGGHIAYGKRGKETSENTSLNIQGLMSHNGSYVDVASQYKPVIKRKYERVPKKRRSGRWKRRQRRRRMRRRRGLPKTPKPLRVRRKKKLKEPVGNLEKIIPKEVKNVVKGPV